MILKIVKKIFAAFLQSLMLLVIGLVIKYLILDSKTSLQDILFWIGAIPIAIFSIGVFGDFYGRGDISYQLSRSVNNQSSNQRGVQDISDLKSGLSWIMAGLFIWFYSYFM